jgi:hypothetical protein
MEMSVRALDTINEQYQGKAAHEESLSLPRREERDHKERREIPKTTLSRFALSAAGSVLLYALFFGNIDRLFPVLTSGTYLGAALVIALALTFSLTYGTCANYFLELLGMGGGKH